MPVCEIRNASGTPAAIRWLLLPALIGLLISCEIENRLELANPYLTARTILALERQQIRYRLGENGIIYYPARLENEVESARQNAYALPPNTNAVIAGRAQARLIEYQFTTAKVRYRAKDLGHFVLLTWEFPLAPPAPE